MIEERGEQRVEGGERERRRSLQSLLFQWLWQQRIALTEKKE
jgi:hypothetical protein